VSLLPWKLVRPFLQFSLGSHPVSNQFPDEQTNIHPKRNYLVYKPSPLSAISIQ